MWRFINDQAVGSSAVRVLTLSKLLRLRLFCRGGHVKTFTQFGTFPSKEADLNAAQTLEELLKNVVCLLQSVEDFDVSVRRLVIR